MTGDEPLVSVLIGTYDRADVLPRAIESVLNQTYSNVEIIVVDDHSPESVRGVVDSYDGPITFVRHEENRGWGAAMNTAFEHADGELLAMIGDDDRWCDPRKLEKQVEALRDTTRENVGIVCTGWRVVSEETGEVKEVTAPERPANLTRHILGQNRIIQSIGAVVTREAWEAVGGTDEEIPRGIDSDLFRRMILDGYDVLFLPDPMIDIYVDRDDRMTAKQRPKDVWPHIESERTKLEKFPRAFDEYPAARARVLEKIGTHFVRIYRSTHDDDQLAQARRHFRESLSYNPLHWKAAVRYLWSFGVQLETVVRR